MNPFLSRTGRNSNYPLERMLLLRLDLLLRNSGHTDINSNSLAISQTTVRKPEKRSLCNRKKKKFPCLSYPWFLVYLFVRFNREPKLALRPVFFAAGVGWMGMWNVLVPSQPFFSI